MWVLYREERSEEGRVSFNSDNTVETDEYVKLDLDKTYYATLWKVETHFCTVSLQTVVRNIY
jgi:hypothetical protein